MAVQRLKKRGSHRLYLSLRVLCALSMIAISSAPIAEEAIDPGASGEGNNDTIDTGAGGEGNNDTVRPKVAIDGTITVPHNGYDIKLYFAADSPQYLAPDSSKSEDGASEIDKNTPLFHEPLIHFRTRADGRLKHKIRLDGALTLYVAMNILESETIEEVKTFLKEDLGLTEDELPNDALIQPLSVRGWFASSADPDIRSQITDVTMTSRKGADILVHFPMSTPKAADSFLSRLNGEEEQLIFRYSLQGDAIQTCTVTATAAVMTNHERFLELTGDADSSKNYVSRKQVADLMSEIGYHESIVSNCSKESAARELRSTAFKRLDAKGSESHFTIDYLDSLTNGVQDDIRTDIVESSNRIKTKEERDEVQHLSQQVKSKAITFGAFVSAIIQSIPFSAEAVVDTSHASGEAYQSMYDNLKRVHDEFTWTGKRYKPKTVDVYRTEQLRNALNQSIRLTHNEASFAKDVRSIPISRKNWIPEDKERPSSPSPLQVFSSKLVEAEARLDAAEARLDAALDMIEALKAGVEVARLGTHPRPDHPGVWVEGTDFDIDSKVVEHVHDGRIGTEGGKIELNADYKIRIRATGYRREDDTHRFWRGGDVAIDARDDIGIKAHGGIDIETRDGGIDIEARDGGIDIEARDGGIDIKARDGGVDIEARKGITLYIVQSDGSRSKARLQVSRNRVELQARNGSIIVEDGTISLDARRITVGTQSLMDYIRDRY